MTKDGAPQNGSFIEGVCMYQCTVIHYFIFLTISHFLCFLQLTLAVSADSLKCSEKNRLEGHLGAMPSTSYKIHFPSPSPCLFAGYLDESDYHIAEQWPWDPGRPGVSS